MGHEPGDRRRRVLRTAGVLFAIALLIYLIFIAQTILGYR